MPSMMNRTSVIVLTLAAFVAVAGCKPTSVKKVENYLGDENSAVNSPAAEGAKDAAKNLAKEALGPGGTVVDAGEAALGSVMTGAAIQIQKDADAAELAATESNDPALQRRADFLSAKADCFIRKDCKRWYELTGDPNKGGSDGGSH